MAKNFLYHSSFFGALSLLCDRINARNPSVFQKHILIVPDKYTLDAEKRLFQNTHGAFDVEVLTLSRLFHRLCEPTDYLAKEGAVMMIRSILENLELNCFKLSARFSGFSEKLYDSINALREAGVQIETATSPSPSVAAKLDDIKLVYNEFKKRTENKFVDRNGRLQLLARAIPKNADKLKNWHFYISGFMNFTALETAVINALETTAASLTLALVGSPSSRSSSSSSSSSSFPSSSSSSFSSSSFSSSSSSTPSSSFHSSSFTASSASSVGASAGCAGDSVGASAGCAGEYHAPRVRCGEVEVYDAFDRIGALKAAARRIRSAVYNGLRFRDIAVVLSEPSFSEAERIFAEFEIPAFIDHRLELSAHPVSVYLELLMDILDKNYYAPSMIEAAKNVCFSVKKADSDAFENYLNEFNPALIPSLADFTFDAKSRQNKDLSQATHNKSPAARSDDLHASSYLENDLSTPFAVNHTIDLHASSYLENDTSLPCSEYDAAAGRAYLAIIEKTRELAADYKSIASCEQFSNLIKRAIEQIEPLLVEKIDRADTAIERILGILTLMEKVLGSANHSLPFFRKLFTEGLAAGKIMDIPRLSDSVTVAVPSTFRGQEFKYVMVIGLNEGEIPAKKPQKGLLVGLENDINGFSHDETNENIVELDHILHACSKKLFLSFESSSEDGQSLYLKALIESCKTIITHSSEELELAALTLSTSLYDDLILDYCSARAGAVETLITGVAAFQSYGVIADFYASLNAALGGRVLDRFFDKRPKSIKINAKNLFFYKNEISVSRLREYFSCPYSHFIKYGLRAKEPKNRELLAIDVGRILHAVAEQFTKHPFTVESAKDLAATYLDNILSSETTLYNKMDSTIKNRLKSDAATLLTILASHFEKGKFQKLGQEISLLDLKHPLVLSADGVSLSLDGSVDFADVYRDYVRIIDYKTGDSTFRFSDLYFGRAIQLPLYMQAFIENGFEPAGFFYFPFRARWDDDARTHRLDGAFCEDFELLFALDSTLALGAASDVIKIKTAFDKKTGDLKISGHRKFALSKSQLKSLCAYAKRVAEQAIREIGAGIIAPLPYKTSERFHCEVCKYQQICGGPSEVRTQAAQPPREVFNEF